MTTIYVQLLDEGTPTYRPTQAVALGENHFRLLANPKYDPEDEIWEFVPGSVVRCRSEIIDGDQILVARELAEKA